ncbi:MAG: winged helix-turn-helix domain-containing protein [Candidatus Thorarchaeota archaeon]
MTTIEDNAARMTLRIAGVFQEIRDIWARRLDSYYSQMESLVDGQWLEAADILGIIREARLASREALDGLGNDLSSELVHTSNGVVARYEAMRSSLLEEIADLRNEISNLSSGDENAIRRENIALRDALLAVPEFDLLQIIQRNRRMTYDQLCEESGQKKSAVRKQAKELMKRGHINIDKKSRPHAIVYLSAPWSQRGLDQQVLEPPPPELHLPTL